MERSVGYHSAVHIVPTGHPVDLLLDRASVGIHEHDEHAQQFLVEFEQRYHGVGRPLTLGYLIRKTHST